MDVCGLYRYCMKCLSRQSVVAALAILKHSKPCQAPCANPWEQEAPSENVLITISALRSNLQGTERSTAKIGYSSAPQVA